MRVHISLDDDLVRQLDQRVGARHRSAFISHTIRRALEDERRWEDIEAGLGALAATAHEWDSDPAAWVTAQRTGDASRVG
ncbi:MAG TPA: ribbon-helix-helix domain-containing protein [Solirubrobacteraceae bacterium]|jgi:metal-responsive CopG/Arc/MetJ family transcriptional regulator